MRNLRLLDIYRDTSDEVMKLYGSFGDHETGVFRIMSKASGEMMVIIATRGMGWEHVSVSKRKHTSSWTDMCQVKELFFHEEEAVMQLHPPRSEYVNYMPHCLHLWKPMGVEIPLPPSILVGPKTDKPVEVS
jgi:hypothetical protein